MNFFRNFFESILNENYLQKLYRVVHYKSCDTLNSKMYSSNTESFNGSETDLPPPPTNKVKRRSQRGVKNNFLNTTQAKFRRKMNTAKIHTDPETKNPFLNFLRELRKSDLGSVVRNAADLAIEGGKKWKKMSHQEKHPFIVMAQKYKGKKNIKNTIKRLKSSTKKTQKRKDKNQPRSTTKWSRKNRNKLSKSKSG